MEAAKPTKRPYKRHQTQMIKKLKSKKREKINLKEGGGTIRLMGVARELYTQLTAYLAKCNPCHYHRCCFSFTLRTKPGSEAHPVDTTVSVRDLFNNEEIKSAEDLFKFLRKEIMKFDISRRFLPGVNLHHLPLPGLKSNLKTHE